MADDHDADTARPGGLPDDRHVLAPAWLSRALEAVATDRSGHLAHVVRRQLRPVGPGVGFVSRVQRLELSWSGGDGPSSVVAKAPATEPRNRALAVTLDMYGNEARFYRYLSARTPLAVTCHHVEIDESGHDFVLLLEDMSAADMVDQVSGCPRGRATQLVTALADHHARFWGESGLDGAPWLRPLSDRRLTEVFATTVAEHWPAVRRRFGDSLDARVVALGDRLAEQVPCLTAELARPPRTLAHGDLRLDNVFFAPAGQVSVCDWQLVDRSRGMRDMAYFVTQNLRTADRRSWEAGLVDTYLARLARQGVTGYERDEAWHDYRVALVLGLVYAVIACGGLDGGGARGGDVTHAMFERSASAVLDHDGDALG